MRTKSKITLALASAINLLAMGCDTTEEGGNCSGLAEECWSVVDSCGLQEGCTLEEACQGIGDCGGGIEEWECQLEIECTWVTTCNGTATPCEDLDNEDDCGYQLGCTWEP